MSYYPMGLLLLSACFLISHFPTSYAQSENTSQPEVTIPQGTLLGTTLTTYHGRNISGFLGIPYAQPPTGNLRFANPVAADGWNGTLNATSKQNKCPYFDSDTVLGDEDCLYVNVWSPQLPQNTNSSLLPVMVYIHGGAFKEENPGESGPEFLLDADIVLVSVYYRLGPLGFLSTGDEFASGNWGLKDQVLALQWVQDNVQYFGGDPDQVTIFGESAGSGSVHLLTLSDTTVGLFHRYITQSGSALAPWAHRPRANYSSCAFELGEFVGCHNDASETLISCLRTVDFSQIIATDRQFKVWEFLPDIMWGPTDEPDIEGAFMTDSPANLFAAGKVRDLPWMAGIVRNEGLLHSAALYADEQMLYSFLDDFDSLVPLMLVYYYQSDSGAAWTNAVKSYYFNDDLTSSPSVLLENLTMLIGDSHFYYPLYNALQQHQALAVNPQYVYTFNYRGTFSCSYLFSGGYTANVGVTHADELLYLFFNEASFADLNETMSQKDYEMVDTMVQLWTSFAITGIPAASAIDSTITWEPYSADLDNYLRIGNDSDVGLEVQYSFFKERMEFWAELYAATETQEESGAVTSTPNLLILILVVCSKFLLSAVTSDRLRWFNSN